MRHLYESLDHGPVTFEHLNQLCDLVGSLTEGLRHVGNGLIANARDDQYGRLQLMLCGIERIEEEVFKVAPDMQRKGTTV